MLMDTRHGDLAREGRRRLVSQPQTPTRTVRCSLRRRLDNTVPLSKPPRQWLSSKLVVDSLGIGDEVLVLPLRRDNSDERNDFFVNYP